VKSSDRTILFAVSALVAIAAVWFLLIAPKRDEASTLGTEVDEARVAVEQAEQLAAAAEAAKSDYSENYHHLVVLGKAAPSGDDTASLFIQLDQIAADSGTDLRGISLAEGSSAAEPQAAAQETTADPTQTPSGADPAAATEAPAAPAVPATEASAALLPLGATVGTAGLPVMPYELTLKGDYFQLRDFIDGLQKLVGTKRGRQVIDGRLVTIDSFDFQGDAEKGFPELDATLAVTAYLAPPDQGLTAGATPTGPAPVAPTGATSVPASNTSPATTP
jgi:Tfp pilus assembly protein PilO